MLKRPVEIHWNFKKPPEPFPQTPGCNGVFSAPSGIGKTTTLVAMLLGPYKGIFDQVHVFSPTVDIDSAWLPVKEIAGNLMEGSTLTRSGTKHLSARFSMQSEIKLRTSSTPNQ